MPTLLLLPLGLLSCNPSNRTQGPPSDTRGTLLPAAAASTFASSCEAGDRDACADFAVVFRTAWAESLLLSLQGDLPEGEGREASASFLLNRACDEGRGHPLACRDLRRGVGWWDPSGPTGTPLFDPALPLPTTMTLRDEQGIGCPGLKVGAPAAGPGWVRTDALGRVRLPEAMIVEVTSYSDAYHRGRGVEAVELASPFGVPMVPLRESPWEDERLRERLLGRWKRSPGPASYRSVTRSCGYGLNLPGTTGGGEPPTRPPARLRFEVGDDPASDELLLNGEPVEVVVGLGLIRVDRGDHDDWLIPIDADTLVLPEYRTGDWDYPEVYVRD